VAGLDWRGMARSGKDWQGRQGEARTGTAWSGRLGMIRLGLEWSGRHGNKKRENKKWMQLNGQSPKTKDLED